MISMWEAEMIRGYCQKKKCDPPNGNTHYIEIKPICHF